MAEKKSKSGFIQIDSREHQAIVKRKKDTKKYAGGGRAMRGYGKAYMKGGRVGYAGAGLVGKGKSMGVPTPIRLSLVKQAKARLKKGKQ